MDGEGDEGGDEDGDEEREWEPETCLPNYKFGGQRQRK